MHQCKAIGCTQLTSAGDFCVDCEHQQALDATTHPRLGPGRALQAPSGRSTEAARGTSSGGDNDYWIVKITHPKRLQPYEAECEDLIEHFQMTFQEGEAFKALWRKGQARIGNGKPGDSPLRNAQKVRHFGSRMEVMEERLLEAGT